MKFTCCWRKVQGKCYDDAIMHEEAKYLLCKKRIRYINQWINELKNDFYLVESNAIMKNQKPYLDGYSWMNELQEKEEKNEERMLNRGCSLKPTKCELQYGMLQMRLRRETQNLQEILLRYNLLVQLMNSYLSFYKKLQSKKGATYIHFLEEFPIILFYWYDHEQWLTIKNVSTKTEGVLWIAERGNCGMCTYSFQVYLQPSKKVLEGTAFASHLDDYMLQVRLKEQHYDAYVLMILMKEAYALMSYLNHYQTKKKIGGVWMAIDQLSKVEIERLEKKGHQQGFRCIGRVNELGCYEEDKMIIKRNKGY